MLQQSKLSVTLPDPVDEMIAARDAHIVVTTVYHRPDSQRVLLSHEFDFLTVGLE